MERVKHRSSLILEINKLPQDLCNTCICHSSIHLCIPQSTTHQYIHPSIHLFFSFIHLTIIPKLSGNSKKCINNSFHWDFPLYTVRSTLDDILGTQGLNKWMRQTHINKHMCTQIHVLYKDVYYKYTDKWFVLIEVIEHTCNMVLITLQWEQ